ncbi:phosphatidate cytidylyltransferase [Janibacter corallicola]|uniref:phosphatidate cytidylyltransferase n=1 Tax=Janibacter corallicola TaxID=415212 RepID=UPI00082CDC06|nr:phosphatidate cytidylyltransferase [Janibacter corallicola]
MSDPEAARHAAPAASGGSGRAGRNLPVAIAVGVLLGAVAVSCLLIHPVAFAGLVAVALVLAVWEMREALAKGDLHVPFVPVLVGALGMVLAGRLEGAQGLVLATTLAVVAVVVWRVAEGVTSALRDSAAGALVLLYPCFLAGFAVLMVSEPQGRWRIFLFILVTVFSDIGGYAFGVLFGKHPMAPRLSPKKSWEGFAGSVLSCAVVGAIAVPLAIDGLWWQGALLGAVVAPVATIGDLIESSIKRNLGVKDMSNLIPGHGGLMDRLDSLVLTAPLAWWVLRLIAPY